MLFSFIIQGIGCAREGIPGVYSRVSGAIGWIESQICALSSNPSKGCGGGGAPGGTRVRVDILHDYFPTDTGWSIKNDSGETIMSSRPGSVNEEEVLVSTYVALENGVYYFEIIDSHGDGLTQGEWKIIKQFPDLVS
jgi:hypothetical protein